MPWVENLYSPLQVPASSTTGYEPMRSYIQQEFMFDTKTVEPPTGSEVRGNNADQKKIKKLWVMNLDVDGSDVTRALALINYGMQVFLQDKDESSRVQSYFVTGEVVLKGNYTEIPVVWQTGDQPLVPQRILFVAK